MNSEVVYGSSNQNLCPFCTYMPVRKRLYLLSPNLNTFFHWYECVWCEQRIYTADSRVELAVRFDLSGYELASSAKLRMLYKIIEDDRKMAELQHTPHLIPNANR